MPLIYGQNNETALRSNDIDQYTKWFNIMDMDFQLMHIGNSWICEAWSRDKDAFIVSTSGRKNTITEALHSCYSEIKSLYRFE
jgi:hypothetical protein